VTLSHRIRDASLWLVGLGLMLASSGLDGVYMAKWMPPLFAWLGLVLNTTADIANLVLAYWYTRFRQTTRKGSKRHQLAALLLPAEIVSVTYSWFFSWRQLRLVLPATEPQHWRWVAPIAAGFVPLLLAFIGWAQALLAGKMDEEPLKPEKTEEQLRLEFARDYNTPRKVSLYTAFQVMRRDGYRCYYCSKDLRNLPTDHVHIDHFIPRKEGGSNDLDNLVVSCKECNLQKSDRVPSLDDFTAFQEYIERKKAEQEGFVCDVCGFIAANQNGLNAHQRKHKRDNGHKKELQVAASRSES